MSFDSTGKKLVTCGTDGICKVWNVECNISPTATLLGHEAEISQVGLKFIASLYFNILHLQT